MKIELITLHSDKSLGKQHVFEFGNIVNYDRMNNFALFDTKIKTNLSTLISSYSLYLKNELIATYYITELSKFNEICKLNILDGNDIRVDLINHNNNNDNYIVVNFFDSYCSDDLLLSFSAIFSKSTMDISIFCDKTPFVRYDYTEYEMKEFPIKLNKLEKINLPFNYYYNNLILQTVPYSFNNSFEMVQLQFNGLNFLNETIPPNIIKLLGNDNTLGYKIPHPINFGIIQNRVLIVKINSDNADIENITLRVICAKYNTLFYNSHDNTTTKKIMY